MHALFVENGDSFSWNVVDALPFERSELRIVSGPDRGALDGARAVIVGPGPGDPHRAGLVGFVAEVAARGTPLLGICLGHQAIGLAFGARLVRARPVHGEVSRIRFQGSRWFDAFGESEVMRYHSLALVDLASPLKVTATTDDGVVMALEHAHLPIAGLQFHPDSFATPNGVRMLEAFFRGVA